jgi:hypothetical protein
MPLQIGRSERLYDRKRRFATSAGKEKPQIQGGIDNRESGFCHWDRSFGMEPKNAGDGSAMIRLRVRADHHNCGGEASEE